MVGSAICRGLAAKGYNNYFGKDISELDLTNQVEVDKLFAAEKPNYVIVAAAKVGGIYANNTYRAQFIYENLMIESNVIHAAHVHGVEKLIFLGSSCIYPKLAPQPLKEETLLSGFLEETNEPYAIAKIAGIKLCENYYRQYGSNFFSVMPTNMYGPYDNFNLETSHVMPALIRKFHEAKKNGTGVVTLWGTGTPYREFLYVEDLADALIHLLENVNAADFYGNGYSHVNIGTGKDLSIADLAGLIAKVVGFEGKIEYDSTKPDGTPKKLLDVSRMASLGWKYKTELEDGLHLAYKWFLDNYKY